MCKGWRNKAWHGRLMAFLQYLSGGSAHIDVPLSALCLLRLAASPVLFTSPVTTAQSDDMSDDAEESDLSTLGNFQVQDDE